MSHWCGSTTVHCVQENPMELDLHTWRREICHSSWWSIYRDELHEGHWSSTREYWLDHNINQSTESSHITIARYAHQVTASSLHIP